MTIVAATSKAPKVPTLPYVMRFERATAAKGYLVIGMTLFAIEAADALTNGLMALLNPNQFVVLVFFGIILIGFSWLVHASRVELTEDGITWSLRPLQYQAIRWKDIRSVRFVTYGSVEAQRVGYHGPGVVALVLYPVNNQDECVRIVPKFFSVTDLHTLVMQIRDRAPQATLDASVERLANPQKPKKLLMCIQIKALAYVILTLMALFFVLAILRIFN